MSPVRIQRRRVNGWRMPENAVYVGRPGLWGNPYTLEFAKKIMSPDPGETPAQYDRAMREWCVTAYRELGLPEFAEKLRGKDLVCWCSLDQPCHADVLLEVANQ